LIKTWVKLGILKSEQYVSGLRFKPLGKIW
jgi:hypothetical protein